MNFKTGQSVVITCDGRSLPATVSLASENGRSLALSFDSALWNGGGWYVGTMPVLRDADGVYRELMLGHPVHIELLEPAQ